MEIAYIQIWEESSENSDPITIGASIHINEENCINYIESKYKKRPKKVPKKYIYKLGNYTKCMISKTLYEQVKIENGFTFIKDYQLYNLVIFNKIVEI